MIDIKENSKVQIHWKVSPYDYTKELQDAIKAKACKKYKLPVTAVKVVPDFVVRDDSGSSIGLVDGKVKDIQNAEYQIELFKRYIEEKGIEDYDFKRILAIDNEINALMDYTIYDKYNRYSINWINWSNFLSYGDDNHFDFTKVGKIVLLNGTPSNQSGKTTFAIDLIHFLLFGKTTKYKTQDKIFNKHLSEATTVTVEGSLSIDGQEYIISRTLTRPAKSRRTAKSATTQKVSYYKVVAGNKEELEEFVESQTEENTAQTNKAIKQAIGTEDDFDLVVSATESNLDELIDKKDAERGRLLARWIGLLPLEKKDELSRAKYNSEIKPYLISNHYNRETVKSEIESYKLTAKAAKEEIKKFKKEVKETDAALKGLESTRSALLSSKREVDSTLLKLDITTFNRKLEELKANGQAKSAALSDTTEQIKAIGEVNFSHEEYDKASDELSSLKAKQGVLREQYKTKNELLKHYKNSEYCPTCHRKLDNVDNTQLIADTSKELESLVNDGKETNLRIEECANKVNGMKEMRTKYETKNKLEAQKLAYEVQISKLREEYKDMKKTLDEYHKNQEAIDSNNAIEIELRNVEAAIRAKNEARETTVLTIADRENSLKLYEKEVDDRDRLLEKIAEEDKLVKNWKIYLEMVGKDGISKMVLRETLPIINAKLNNILSDVCDFTVELNINNKNEIMFMLCKDGVRSDLSGASGFERTASALALRSVLGSISTLSRPNFFVTDEILGRVAKENYDSMKLLLEKICSDYDFILNITHLDEFKDFCDTEVSVIKENNVSRIVVR